MRGLPAVPGVLHFYTFGGGLNMGSTDSIYRSVFREYPDVMNVRQVSALLGVSTKTVYKLLGDGSLISLKVGREFRVPKINVMKYMKLIAAEK
jgi:excisionase family DNA binding protein